MRPWITVSSSAIAAILLAAALVIPEAINVPRPEIGSVVLAHLPMLAIAGLAMYGLSSILLTTGNLIGGTLRLRQALASGAADGIPVRHGWAAALGAIGSQVLAPRSKAPQGGSSGFDGWQSRLTAQELRSEIAHLYYVSLARNHSLSALIVLAGIFALAVAQDRGFLLLQSAAIPMASAILVTAGLVLVAVLGRIAIDVTAEPLVEAVLRLPGERAEVTLLRRAVELLEQPDRDAAAKDRMPAPPERFILAIEQGHHALLDAVSRLSANTADLEAALRGSVEALDATMRGAAAHPQSPDDGEGLARATAFAELQAALERLTAVLQHLGTAQETTVAAEPMAQRRPAAPPLLAQQLRRLLQEIDTGC